MTDATIGELAIALTLVTGYLLVLGVGGLIADFLLPHIPFIEKYLESLPDWEDEEQEGQ